MYFSHLQKGLLRLIYTVNVLVQLRIIKLNVVPPFKSLSIKNVIPYEIEFHFTFCPDIKNNYLLTEVRMAERSKAPDSRCTLLTDSERAFWSSSEGVGSNPTSDIHFMKKRVKIEVYVYKMFS